MIFPDLKSALIIKVIKEDTIVVSMVQAKSF